MKTQASHEALIDKPEKKQSDKQRIFELIQSKGHTTTEIMAKLNLTKQTVSARLSDLQDEGKIFDAATVENHTWWFAIPPDMWQYQSEKVRANKFKGILRRLEKEFKEEWNTYLNSIKVDKKPAKIETETNFKQLELSI